MFNLKNILVTSDQVVESNKSNGGNYKFGLNPATVKEIVIEQNAGKDKTPGLALDVNLLVGGGEQRLRFYPVTKVYGKNDEGNDIVIADPNHPDMQAAIFNLSGTIFNIFEHLVPNLQDIIAEKIKTAPKEVSFEQFMKLYISTLPNNYTEIPILVFMEYMWTIPEGKDKTYLTVPKTAKFGKIFFKGGTFKEDVLAAPNAEGATYVATYVDTDELITSRSDWYMGSNKAIQQQRTKENIAISEPQVSAGFLQDDKEAVKDPIKSAQPTDTADLDAAW